MNGYENLFSPPATIHHMIPGSGIFDSERSRHDSKFNPVEKSTDSLHGIEFHYHPSPKGSRADLTPL